MADIHRRSETEPATAAFVDEAQVASATLAAAINAWYEEASK